MNNFPETTQTLCAPDVIRRELPSLERGEEPGSSFMAVSQSTAEQSALRNGCWSVRSCESAWILWGTDDAAVTSFGGTTRWQYDLQLSFPFSMCFKKLLGFHVRGAEAAEGLMVVLSVCRDISRKGKYIWKNKGGASECKLWLKKILTEAAAQLWSIFLFSFSFFCFSQVFCFSKNNRLSDVHHPWTETTFNRREFRLNVNRNPMKCKTKSG